MTIRKDSSSTFTKSSRLLTAKEFKWVFDAPDMKIHQPHLMLFIRGNDLQSARLGLAITKKKVPTAVKRNLIKRIARERFRLGDDLPHADMVLIVKKPITGVSRADLHHQMNELLKKLCKKTKAHGLGN